MFRDEVLPKADERPVKRFVEFGRLPRGGHREGLVLVVRRVVRVLVRV